MRALATTAFCLVLILSVWWHSADAQDPRTFCSCRVTGDPHYTTFDGRPYLFMGRCRYTLARSVPQDACSFFVGAQNTEPWHHPALGAVTATLWVYIRMFGRTFVMYRAHTLTADGLRVPSVIMDNRVSITRAGAWTNFVSTRCGVMVRWDGATTTFVSLNRARWNGRVQGLCGNCNGNPADDFQLANGQITRDSNVFANSWLVIDRAGRITNAMCRVPAPPPATVCTGVWGPRAEQVDWCGALNRAGPFSACINNPRARGLNFQQSFMDCRFDVCATSVNPANSKRFACESMAVMADLCAQRGITGMVWRGPTNCPLPCPANQVYASNINPCPMSCAFIFTGRPQSCQNLPPTEGCRCRPGLVRLGNNCVPRASCPVPRGGAVGLGGFGAQLGPGGIPSEIASARSLLDRLIQVLTRIRTRFPNAR